MAPPSKIETERLILRPLSQTDAPTIQVLAADREVASGTDSIPHPYGAGEAEKWIGMVLARQEQGEFTTFAITLTATGEFLGAIGLIHHPEHSYSEMATG